MTRSRVIVRWAGCTLCALLLTGPLVSSQSAKPDANGFVAAQPEDVQPKEGAGQVVIVGDPTKEGLYVVRLTFAAGRGSRPHFHNQARYITVIKGTWYVSLGPESDTYDPSKTVPMKPGSFLYEPANGHHYDMAKDEAVTVQIMGMGPVTTTQIESGTGRGQQP